MKHVHNFFALSLLAVIALLCGCASEQVLTQQEIRIQDAAAAEVSNVLFERGMDSVASYNVRRDGYVVIKFDKSVSFEKYNDVVFTLRGSKAISGVYAEQGGVQVCAPR